MKAVERPNGVPAPAVGKRNPLHEIALEDLPTHRPWVAPLVAAVGLAALVTLLVLPVRYPSVVKTYAGIKCAQEWVLVRGSDGQLSASVLNHRTGLSEGYRAASFDRSSSVDFLLRPDMVPGHGVARGDTVAIISSSETQERLVALYGQLAAAQGQLAVSSSGEKDVVVYAAEQRLEIARRKLGEQQRSFTRTKTLFSQGLVPVGQYEAAENSLHDARDEVAMAAAALEVEQSGAKPEQIELVRRNIAALQAEIAALQRRAATHTIIAPFSGRVARSTSSDVILSIVDTSRYVASIPIPLRDLPRVTATPDARVTLQGLAVPVRGRIVSLDQEVTSVGMQRVVKATAVLDRTPAELVVGLDLRCDVACRPVTAMDLVKRFLRSLVS